MNKKKVLHIVEAFGGGVYNYLKNLTNRQVDKYDVYIAYGERPQLPTNYKELFDNRINWVEVTHFKPILGVKNLFAYIEVRNIIKQVNPDIVHCHSSIAGFLGRFASSTKKRRVFYTPHGYSFLVDDKNKSLKKIYRFFEYLAAKRDSVTIACSLGEKQVALSLSSKVEHVDNGLDLVTLKDLKLLNQQSPNIYINGRIMYQKNPILLNEIAKELPKVNFKWIGDGNMRSFLTSSNILITGWKTEQEVFAESRGCDIFLLTSLWEGLPISLLEAMYMKKICIVSDAVGNRDVIKNGENGYICRTKDEFVSVIKKIISKEVDCSQIVERAHEDIVHIYNADIMAKKYDEIYEKYTK